jgi:hypothetical protein
MIGVSDYSERKIEKTVNSIEAGIPFATERVHEWRKDLYLDLINAGFVGKEQIKARKGEIGYFFYADNVSNNLDADAFVDIDMNKNSIVRFSSSYGTPKQLTGGGGGLKTEKWLIDIDEAFEIATRELGENRIFQYDNPKVVLLCAETFWDFTVFPNPDAPWPYWVVVINPETGEVIRVEDRSKL